MKQRSSRWLYLSIAVVAVVVLGTATAIIDHQLKRQADEQRAAFERVSRLSLMAFSQSTRTALIRGDRETLEAAASLLLHSQAAFVQIVVGDQEVLARKRADLDLPIVSMPWIRFGSGSVAALDASLDLLDLAVPIESTDAGVGIVGYSRAVFDWRPFALALRRRRQLWIGGIAGAGVLCLSTLGILLLRQRRPRAKAAPLTDARPGEEILSVGPFRIDEASKRVLFERKPIRLTPKQFTLLRTLASTPNRVFSEDELIEAIWPTSAYATSADVKQCVYTLRQRLRAVCDNPHALIANVQGYGYKLAIDESERDLTGS